MAAWYVGSVQYTAVAQFASSTAYTVGQIIRQLAAPAVGSERCFRCTTAGTTAGSEPSWTLTKGGTTTSGTAVFTEVTGNSTYAWAAAAARLLLIVGSWAANGDTTYVAQDHAETQTTTMTLTGGAVNAPMIVLCVNAAGSVPPVAADLRDTATITSTNGGASTMVLRMNAYIRGIAFSASAGVNACLLINDATSLRAVLENCQLIMGLNFSGCRMNFAQEVTLLNTKISFANASQQINLFGCTFKWKNTPTAIQGTAPASIFGGASTAVTQALLDGVDLSAITGTLVGTVWFNRSTFNFINCKLNASVTIATAPITEDGPVTNLIISDSGANGYRQERYTYGGALTTEITFTRSGGASDGLTPISWKVVTNANASRYVPFETFQIAEWNSTTGSSVTATVEIESTATLTDAEVWMEVEYLGTSGFPVTSVVSMQSLPLATPANLATSSVTWNGALGSAVKQYLQCSFTPQMAGLVRATVYVGKTSQTVYIDPALTLT